MSRRLVRTLRSILGVVIVTSLLLPASLAALRGAGTAHAQEATPPLAGPTDPATPPTGEPQAPTAESTTPPDQPPATPEAPGDEAGAAEQSAEATPAPRTSTVTRASIRAPRASSSSSSKTPMRRSGASPARLASRSRRRRAQGDSPLP
jgi:hypothetical protein